MKILAIHTANNKDDKKIHQVDIWRIGRPLRELKKHVDWQIDERPTIMKHIAKYKNAKDFTEKELELTVEDLAQYDIIWGSYTAFMHGMVAALCDLVNDKYGTKFVMDVDDDMFAINEDNIGWWLHMTHEKTWEIQTIIRTAKYLTTSTNHLAKRLKERTGKNNVWITPNRITSDYKSPPPDNGDKIVIGYFGGGSHFDDLHTTGMTKALERVMHEHHNVYAKSVGIMIEDYLPRARYEYIGGERGHKWVNKLFPKLQFDISLAPLTGALFNYSKSDIKWQESARMRAAFIGSNVGPYAETVKDGVDGLLVRNTEDAWYAGLKKLVEDAEYRKKLANNAYNRVKKDFLLENNWQTLKRTFEEIAK